MFKGGPLGNRNMCSDRICRKSLWENFTGNWNVQLIFSQQQKLNFSSVKFLIIEEIVKCKFMAIKGDVIFSNAAAIKSPNYKLKRASQVQSVRRLLTNIKSRSKQPFSEFSAFLFSNLKTFFSPSKFFFIFSFLKQMFCLLSVFRFATS